MAGVVLVNCVRIEHPKRAGLGWSSICREQWMGGEVGKLAEGKHCVAYRQRLSVLVAVLQREVALRSRGLCDTR